MGAGMSGNYSNTKGASSSSETLVKQLEQSGVKFSKNDMVFVTKDKTGQVVWLEKGSSSSGLKHILDGDGLFHLNKIGDILADIIVNAELAGFMEHHNGHSRKGLGNGG